MQLRELLTTCLNVPRWVDAVAGGRPYRDVDAVVAAARRAADPFTDEEVAGALAHHPRIGDRAAGDTPEAVLSRQEQSGVDPGDEAVAQQLRMGNLAYEERFGHVFLICAAGRSATQILAALGERLARSPEQERVTTAEELRAIAVLRLEGALGS